MFFFVFYMFLDSARIKVFHVCAAKVKTPPDRPDRHHNAGGCSAYGEEDETGVGDWRPVFGGLDGAELGPGGPGKELRGPGTSGGGGGHWLERRFSVAFCGKVVARKFGGFLDEGPLWF